MYIFIISVFLDVIVNIVNCGEPLTYKSRGKENTPPLDSYVYINVPYILNQLIAVPAK